MGLLQLLNDKRFNMLFSFVLGVGIICLFRPICKGSECELNKPPSDKDFNKYVYRMGDKCYEFKTEKNGNKTLATGCMFCPHKWECHSDANGGKGLRVFKYSNKNVMLAEVVKQPNVDEITNQYKEQLKNYGKRTSTQTSVN